MKSSCITHPARETLIKIHRWQYDFCGGDSCAAALMSYFEYWHNIRLDMAGKAGYENKVAEMHGERGTQNTSLWQFHTTEDLRSGIMFLYSDKAIRVALRKLVDMGIIEIGRNPNPRYAFDNTKHFLFHPEVAMDWLVASGRIGNSNVAKTPTPYGENAGRCGENAGPDGESAGTIPETTTEITKENTPYMGGGEQLLASKSKGSTIASGSNLNGAGSKANAKGNAAAPTTSLDQLATDAGVDATTYQSLVNLITNAAGTTEAVAAGNRKSLTDATEATTTLVKMDVRTVEAMTALITAWRADNPTRKYAICQSIVEYHSKKQQEIKAKAAATDPDENPMITVEQLLVDLDGKPEWVETKMRKLRFERELAKGANVRLPLPLAAD